MIPSKINTYPTQRHLTNKNVKKKKNNVHQQTSQNSRLNEETITQPSQTPDERKSTGKHQPTSSATLHPELRQGKRLKTRNSQDWDNTLK